MDSTGGGMLADALAQVVGEIPPALLTPEASARVASSATTLPAGFDAAFLECRPASPDHVDLLVCSTARKAARRTFCEQDAWNRPGWEFASSILSSWLDSSCALHEVTPLVWLELDDAGSTAGLPAPSACVCLESQYLRFPAMGPPRPADWVRVSREVLNLPMCPSPARNSLPMLQRCFDELPDSGRPIHLSVMSAREPSLAKLYVALPTPDVAAYLERIGWPGSLGEVERFLADAPRPEPLSYIDLALDPRQPLPRIAFAFPAPLRGAGFDARGFDRLAQLIGKPGGGDDLRSSLEQWAERRTSIAGGSAWPHSVHRWVDQKVVFPDDELPELKLYLGVRPLPMMFGAAQGNA